MDSGKIIETVLREINRSVSGVSHESLEALVDAVNREKRIFCDGAGRSRLKAEGFAMRLTQMGFTALVVGEATNGEEGIAAVERYNPNLIITDIRMPKLDGIEMLRRLREEGNRAHVVFLTAYSDFSYAQSALKLGAADYLLKPFRDQDLMSAIARVREKEGAAQPAEDTLLLPKGDKSKYVLQTLNYIAEHYADTDINIASIARHIGISEGHLSHVFKKETNYTALGYLTQYRIHTARKLLRDCRYKVYEVAEMVGYRDVAYFGSTFKKLTGMSPSEYQDRCR